MCVRISPYGVSIMRQCSTIGYRPERRLGLADEGRGKFREARRKAWRLGLDRVIGRQRRSSARRHCGKESNERRRAACIKSLDNRSETIELATSVIANRADPFVLQDTTWSDNPQIALVASVRAAIWPPRGADGCRSATDRFIFGRQEEGLTVRKRRARRRAIGARTDPVEAKLKARGRSTSPTLVMGRPNSMRACSLASTTPSTSSTPRLTTTARAKPHPRLELETRGLCRHFRRNWRSAAQPRSAPPVACCSHRTGTRDLVDEFGVRGGHSTAPHCAPTEPTNYCSERGRNCQSLRRWRQERRSAGTGRLLT
jgi:hypothetical protein